MIPVDEDMMRRKTRKEDVGGATLRERNDFFCGFWRREGEIRTLKRPVHSASVVRNSSVEENVGR